MVEVGVAGAVVGLELVDFVAVVGEVADVGTRWTADPFVAAVVAVDRPAVDSWDPHGADTPG